ncbi:MAG: dihydrofolate reductase [Pirellulales bacterium]|nr:dihydrofolate reductase [Pirellulales bacterium]
MSSQSTPAPLVHRHSRRLLAAGRLLARLAGVLLQVREIQLSRDLKLIAAMTADRVIGLGDGLPWHVPAEYGRYLQTIAGQTVIMGRRSFEIFGSDLTSRCAIVVSRSVKRIVGAAVCPSLDAAVRQGSLLGGEVFINGGQSIYEQALPQVDEMQLSIIKGRYAGDAYFPAFDEADWVVIEQCEYDQYQWRRYRRRPPGA